MLEAFSRQMFEQLFEVILVDNEKYQNSVPEHLYNIVPNLKLVAVLEADAPPCEVWLCTLVESLRMHPEVSVATGKTSYGMENTYKRVLNLIDHSHNDFGKAGMSPYIYNNGAFYRRGVLTKFLYPDAAMLFLASRLRDELMKKAGYKFYFEPGSVTYHAIGGWKFIKNVRRNMRYSNMKIFLTKSAIAQFLV